jgi:hypothetical protein
LLAVVEKSAFLDLEFGLFRMLLEKHQVGANRFRDLYKWVVVQSAGGLNGCLELFHPAVNARAEQLLFALEVQVERAFRDAILNGHAFHFTIRVTIPSKQLRRGRDYRLPSFGSAIRSIAGVWGDVCHERSESAKNRGLKCSKRDFQNPITLGRLKPERMVFGLLKGEFHKSTLQYHPMTD